jgi:phenylpyruvate tautomerase PptA (4-oxalocrotonate tautomerase family)
LHGAELHEEENQSRITDRRSIARPFLKAFIGRLSRPSVPRSLFQIITEHGLQTEIVHALELPGFEYSDGLTIIQLTVSNTRTVEQKKRLFARIAAHLIESPGLRPEDVFINLVEVKKENWSFGNGEAQYA